MSKGLYRILLAALFVLGPVARGEITFTPTAQTVQQGSAPVARAIATACTDWVDPVVSVSVINAPTGVSITNIVHNGSVRLPDGTCTTTDNVTAVIQASCTALTGPVTFQAIDSEGSAKVVTVTYTVQTNTPPVVSPYTSPQSVALFGSLDVFPTPNVPPSDNGTIVSFTATSPTYTGGLLADLGTGRISLTNAQPTGTHTINVTATDNCGATTTQSFQLNVGGNTPPAITPQAAPSISRGSVPQQFLIATVTDVETPTQITVTAEAPLPPGIAITALSTNAAGQVTASFAADCTAAPIGPATVILRATDPGGLFSTANYVINVTANTPPTLGAYPATAVNLTGSTVVAPSAAPADNGSVIALTAAAPGFSGTLSGDPATGAITVGNAGPAAGPYTVTVTATDNCGAQTTTTFTLTVGANTPPTIAAGGAVNRKIGDTTAILTTIATVLDAETPAGSLTVATTAVPAGIIVSGIVNNGGTVQAYVQLTCGAALGPNLVGLRVTDGGGLTATTTFTVNVSANTPPVLNPYPSPTIVAAGSTVNITPAAPPSDPGGTITSITAAAPGFTGTFAADLTTGVITVANAGPAGTYAVQVTALDNCGQVGSTSFQLQVSTQPITIVPAAGITRQAGSPGGGAVQIATVSQPGTPPGSLVVTAPVVPFDVTVSAIANAGGTVSAIVTAGCTAVPGPNTIVLAVTDPQGATANANLIINVTANSPPVLAAYPPSATVALGGSVTVLAGAAPSDPGGPAGSPTLTVAAPLFTGTLAVNSSTGAVTVSNAGPAGTFVVTVTATDNCGATAVRAFQLGISNQPPTISTLGFSPVAVVAGDPSLTNVDVAKVNDVETPLAQLTVAAVSVPAGITVAGPFAVNALGVVTAARIGAVCNLPGGAYPVVLRVVDSGGLTAEDTLFVNVTAAQLPALTATNSGPVCEGGFLQLAVTEVPGATYAWTGPNGFSSSGTSRTVSIFDVTPAAAGTYTVVVTKAGGCVLPSVATNVVVNALPNPAITAPATALTGQSGLTASMVANPGSTYLWTIVNGTITAGQGTPQVTFTAGDVGPLTLTGRETNLKGCTKAVTATVSVVAGGFVVSAIAPNFGPPEGGTLVTLTGSGFKPGATVTIGGLPATNVVWIDGTTLQVVTPAHAPETVSVVVMNPGGATATLRYGFNFATPGGAGPCVTAGTTLCVNRNRFKAVLTWRNYNTDAIAVAPAVLVKSDSGYFWFFGPNNVEVMFKVLDGRGVNGKFWVLYGALSDVEYDILVTDTVSGVAKHYYNPPHTQASVADVNAFTDPAAGWQGTVPPLQVAEEPETPEAPAVAAAPEPASELAGFNPCLPGGENLCLGSPYRFRVKVLWTNYNNGVSAYGQAVPLMGAVDSGYFWFFNENNIELVVKVLDGTGVNGHFWVFYGALTDVEYTLTIDDTLTGASKTYYNPARNLASVSDITAF